MAEKLLTGASTQPEVKAAEQGKVEGQVDNFVRGWLDEISDAMKREKDWRKDAKAANDLYEAKTVSDNSFNILYSNTETLAPALYNNTPRPVVKRLHDDDNPLAKLAARVMQRALVYQLDPGDMEVSPFDNLIEQAVLEALVPGRGVTRFKYDATFVEAEPAQGEQGEAPQAEKSEKVATERVVGEEICYNRVLFGYAARWKDVPWLAFEHFLTREEAIDLLGPEVGANIELTVSPRSADDKDGEDSPLPEGAEGAKLAHLYEIWDKTGKKVHFISPGWKVGKVKESVEDPLELVGFFPIPEPLQFTAKISSQIPTPMYRFYEQQAKELNRISIRINKIVTALKVRGFYDSTVEGMEKVMEADDNTLIPADNSAGLAQGKGLDSAIWLMPIEKLINVLQQLYAQRQQVKQVIYEITGLSDILRGASVASETATAQNIKSQWGTLRLKRMQKRVMLYVRQCLRLQAQIMVKKFSTETFAKITGLNFPTAAQKQQAQVIVQQLMQQALQSAPPQPGQPPQPQPSPVPPEIQQILAQPSWEDILGLLRNDLTRSYSIDIETNSTVDVEATEDKELIGEFLNAVSQFLNGIAPLVQQGIMPFEAAKSMLLAVTRRFRFGQDVEDQLAAMKAPPPPPPQAEGDGGAAAAQKKAELELQVAQAEAQGKLAIMQEEQKVTKLKVQLQLQELQRKEELAALKHQSAMLQLRTQMAAAALPTAPQGGA